MVHKAHQMSHRAYLLPWISNRQRPLSSPGVVFIPARALSTHWRLQTLSRQRAEGMTSSVTSGCPQLSTVMLLQASMVTILTLSTYVVGLSKQIPILLHVWTCFKQGLVWSDVLSSDSLIFTQQQICFLRTLHRYCGFIEQWHRNVIWVQKGNKDIKTQSQISLRSKVCFTYDKAITLVASPFTTTPPTSSLHML